jgi:hypothetical protein
VASFIRKVPTASGARAVQIMHKRGRHVVGIEHIGSPHDDVQLAVLMEVTRQQLHAGQETRVPGPEPTRPTRIPQHAGEGPRGAFGSASTQTRLHGALRRDDPINRNRNRKQMAQSWDE